MGTFKPPSHLRLPVCVHVLYWSLHKINQTITKDHKTSICFLKKRPQNQHMFSKIPGLRGILEAIYTDVSKDISDKFWHVPQLWKIQNLKTLTNPNWKWWVQDSSLCTCRWCCKYVWPIYNVWCIISTYIFLIELFSLVNNFFILIYLTLLCNFPWLFNYWL